MADFHTSIATSDASSVTIRGFDLVEELIGKRTFTEMTYLSICSRMPTETESRLLDACLVTLMEHGFTPSSLVSRIVADSAPDDIQAAMAAGLACVGPVFVGTMESCARLLKAGVDGTEDPDAYCERIVAEYRTTRKALPGFGHPFHKPDDPRTPRLLSVAREQGVEGKYIDMLQRLSRVFDKAIGKHMTINATGAIGAILLEIGVPIDAMRGVAVVSRAAGLIAHIREEHEQHTARYLWKLCDENIPYRP